MRPTTYTERDCHLASCVWGGMGVGVLQEVGMRMERSNLQAFKIDDGGIIYISEPHTAEKRERN